MIDSSNNITTVPGSTPLAHRKPESVEPPPQARDEPSRSGRPAVPLAPEDAEALVQNHLESNKQNNAYQSVSLGLRGRQAVDAYASTQSIDEREYVTKLLGVDEHV